MKKVKLSLEIEIETEVEVSIEDVVTDVTYVLQHSFGAEVKFIVELPHNLESLTSIYTSVPFYTELSKALPYGAKEGE